jgi:hypothetical protein
VVSDLPLWYLLEIYNAGTMAPIAIPSNFTAGTSMQQTSVTVPAAYLQGQTMFRILALDGSDKTTVNNASRSVMVGHQPGLNYAGLSDADNDGFAANADADDNNPEIYPFAPVVNFTINSGADTNGSISPAGATAVPSGSNKTYTVTPNPGFIVAVLVVDGTHLPGATSYTFTGVTTAHYINAYFAPAPPFTITAGSAGNGSISPLGATSVQPGTSQTFYFTPDPGFAVMALVVDGTILPAATSYTFTGVTADHYLNAYFGAVISAGADSNGSISSPGASIVAAGDSKTYTITPNPGYRVAALVVDGTLLPGATSYTFTGVTTGHYINAYFEPAVTVTVTIDGSGSGTINSSPAGILCESGSTANCAAPFPTGSRVELYAAAATSSLFSGWSNGCSGSGSCTIDPLTTATGVTATFTSNTKIKLAGTQALHATLQSAYTAAGDGETFLLQVYAFIENLCFSLPKSIKLKGGQNSNYDGTIGMTTIQGSLTVEQGSVELSDVAIW